MRGREGEGKGRGAGRGREEDRVGLGEGGGAQTPPSVSPQRAGYTAAAWERWCGAGPGGGDSSHPEACWEV